MLYMTDEEIKKRMNSQFNLWRTELNQYEKEQFLPFMESYIDGFIEYFESIKKKCLDCANQPQFWPQIQTLINKFDQHLDDEGAIITAQAYYLLIADMAETNYLTPLKQLKLDASKIQNVKEMTLWLTRLKQICGTILNVKEKMFLYKLSGWFAIRNITTGQIHNPLPMPELTIFFVPFQSILENLITECTYLLGSIENWSKEQLEWKTAYLNTLNSAIQLKNTKLTLWINVLTVFVAVVISWVFLVVAPPFEKLRVSLENSHLIKKFEVSDKDLESLRKDLETKEQKIRELDLASKNLESELIKARAANDSSKLNIQKPTSPKSNDPVPTSNNPIKKEKPDGSK